MKGFKITSLCVFVFLSISVSAQEVKLDTYKFGEGLNFSTDDGYTMRITGYLQPYMETKTYTDFDENSTQNRFRMRRIRIRFDGNLKNERFKYRFAFDLSGTSEAGDNTTSDYLLDAHVSYDITSRIRATFGQRSTFTDNRELFMLSNTLQLVERSRLTSAFASIREFGLFLQGNFRTGNGSYLKPYFVLTNGDGLNAIGKDFGGLKVGGRIDYLPFGLFTNFGQFRQADVVREQAPKLVIGTNYSYNNGITSRRGRDSGRILYINDANDNGLFDAGEESLPDFIKFGVDFLFKYQGFSVLGEFVKTYANVPNDINLRNDYLGANPEIFTDRFRGRVSPTSPDFRDYTPQEYVRRQMMLGEAYNIQAGYLFKSGISIDGRYTHLKADENSYLNNATFYNRPNYYTLGISKYLSRNYGAKIQADWTYISGSDGILSNEGVVLPGDEHVLRIMLTFAF